MNPVMLRILLVFLFAVSLAFPAGFANAGESKKELVFVPFKDYKRPPKKEAVEKPKPPAAKKKAAGVKKPKPVKPKKAVPPQPAVGKKIDTSKNIVVTPSTNAYIATPRRPKEPAAEDLP